MHSDPGARRAPRPLLAAWRGLLAAGVLVGATACDLDVENPNAPTREESLGDPEGMVSLAVGMQGQFASQVEELIQAPALVTDEWGTGTRSLLSYRALFLTGPGFEIDRSFGVVEEPWAAAYEVVRSADDLLVGVPQTDLPEDLGPGILATARLFRAMALGTLAQQFERMPVEIEGTEPAFVHRDEVFATVLDLLEQARSDVAEADLALTERRVLGEGFDLPNTIDAMLARYHLFAGNHQEAIAAADRVDPGVLSVFTYTSTTQNPIENLVFQLEYVDVLHSWAEEAEPGDGRVDYWSDSGAEPRGGNPPDTLLIPLERYRSPTATFPVYLPDEMRLIRAEAHTRLGDFEAARAEIDAVRTQSSAPVDEPVADLPALPAEELDTEEELLDQIAYERRYELYSQGLRWEDVRRLGEERTVTPTTDFLPIPEQECLNNPNAPC